MTSDIGDNRFKLLDEDENYKMFQYYNYYKVHRTSCNYWIEGKKENVLARIQQEYNAYHPCGYSTNFKLVSENLEDNTVIYNGYRSCSCD